MLRINPARVQPMPNNQKNNAKDVNFGLLRLRYDQKDAIPFLQSYHDLKNVISSMIDKNLITMQTAKGCRQKLKGGITLITNDELEQLKKVVGSNNKFREQLAGVRIPHPQNSHFSSVKPMDDTFERVKTTRLRPEYFSASKSIQPNKPYDVMEMWDIAFSQKLDGFLKKGETLTDDGYQELINQVPFA